MERKRFSPTTGTHYMNCNGLEYVCLYVSVDGSALMQAVKSKWTFTAIDIGMYNDGTIDWAYSRGGYFDENN